MAPIVVKIEEGCTGRTGDEIVVRELEDATGGDRG